MHSLNQSQSKNSLYSDPIVLHRLRSGRLASNWKAYRRGLATLLCTILSTSIVQNQDYVAGQEVSVEPSSIELRGNFAQVQLLVSEAGSASVDRTADAVYELLDPNIAMVTPNGSIRSRQNGKTVLRVRYRDASRDIPVEVHNVEANPVVDFINDVQPVLYRAGCNAGSCHASQYGKGGFTLSVMGFDPNADHSAMVKQGKGRRVDLASPADSLLLKKGTQAVPHGGGVRFLPDSLEYSILHAWIANQAPGPRSDVAKVSKLALEPAVRVLEFGKRQQYRAIAHYSDGSQKDVTALARFDIMDESTATLRGHGLVEAVGKGQSPVMARFSGHAELATVVSPFLPIADLSSWVPLNFIDEHASTKFQELGLTPSGLCDDLTFLRRSTLDATGTLPTIEQIRAFVGSTDPNKREKWVDHLLGFDQSLEFNDVYSAYWSLKWSDLIRNNSTVVGESGMWALHNWIRDSFRENKPMDRFVAELVTAKGSIFSNGPANYFRIANNPQDLAETTSQLFLGTRLQCAKCHHHPYEKYSQADYYGFAAFFARVGTKGSAEFGTFGGDTVVMVNSGGEVTHPKTGAVLKPTPLYADPIDDPIDRRIPLAKWLTSKENDYFARNIVNRYVAYLLGRGLVDPIDDMRSTNPPSNKALMDALVNELRSHDFNVKYLMRTIMCSRLYQLDSQPNESNANDTRFYSHYRVKRLGAETLLDAIDYATGSMTKHPNLPLGTRCIELPDANTTNPFLITFGKPKRASVCECERSPDENLAQALHTLNGDVVASKIVDGNGRIAKAMAASKPSREIVEELYLVTLGRLPTEEEQRVATELVGASTPVEAYQDLLWALLNSKSFLFVR